MKLGSILLGAGLLGALLAVTNGCKGRASGAAANDGTTDTSGNDTAATGAGTACPNPTAEVCDGIDNNCDGQIDEGCPCTNGAHQACGTDIGVCVAGVQTCVSGAWGDCVGQVKAVAEACDGVDNNCDGQVDEGCSCVDGATQTCGESVGVCTQGTQTCAGGIWASCTGGTGPAAEICDGIDNDCDGQIDEGCDKDGDGHCDASMVVVGTPAVCPLSPANAGDDCNDNAAAAHPGAAEICDNLDNDCSGGIDEGCDKDGDGYCDAAMTVVGTPTVCPHSATNTGDDCNDNNAALNPGATEVCDDIDNNCVAGIDEGCDNDSDGYCDATMVVVGTPAICPNSPANTADDCDDNSAAAHPGAVEICTDGIDNDCNGLVDLLDIVPCPLISVTIYAPTDPIAIKHGASQNVMAYITPTDTGVAWSRVWSVIAVSDAGACSPGDVTLGVAIETSTSSSMPVTMPAGAAKLGCIYTLQVVVGGYATATVQVHPTNAVPTITAVSPGAFDGLEWRVFAAAGTTPTLTATATDLDFPADAPLSFTWTGADVGLLNCGTPGCPSSDGTSPFAAPVSFAAPISPGTYHLTVSVRDAFLPTTKSANITLQVDTCLWVSKNGDDTNTGASPGVCGAPCAGPLLTIGAALTQAKAAANTSVCVMGNGAAAIFAEDLTMPASPNTPRLVGGFTLNTGAPSTDRPIVRASVAGGLAFDPGHMGVVQHLAFENSTAGATVVSITDASPNLLDCNVTLPGGTGPVGIAVSDTLGGGTAPFINGGTITTAGATPTDATGIRIVTSTAGNATPTISAMSSFMISSCSGTCRGIDIHKGANAVIQGIANLSVSGSGVAATAIGIDVQGEIGTPTQASITDNSTLSAGGGGTSVAIRLSQTDGVVIARNTNIGSAWIPGGSSFGAGIADGMVLRTGAVTNGASSNLSVYDNHAISGPSTSVPCTNPGDTGEGIDVTVGIFLAATTDVTITGNGRPSAQGSGIVGGSTTPQWTKTRRLSPSPVGLWLVDTSTVNAMSNEIRAGTYVTATGCPVVEVNPEAVGYRDGLPPNSFAGAAAELSSSLTTLDANGITCSRPMQSGMAPSGDPKHPCIAAELNAPLGAAGAPLLINNYLAATKGTVLIGLQQNGGDGVVAANNTFDADLLLEPFEPLPDPNSIEKAAVIVDHISAGGLSLINNIVYTHRDDPYDVVGERLCVKEKVSAGTDSNIALLSHNLFYIEGDDLSSPAAPYVRVSDGASTVNYTSAQVNGVAGVLSSVANLAALPGLREEAHDWTKSSSRLLAGSLAIDAGLGVGGSVPVHDIDLQTRPQGAGVDIGHDEL